MSSVNCNDRVDVNSRRLEPKNECSDARQPQDVDYNLKRILEQFKMCTVFFIGHIAWLTSPITMLSESSQCASPVFTRKILCMAIL